MTTGLGEPLVATIQAPDGNYAINVEVVSETKKPGEKAGKEKLTPKGKVKQSEDRPQLGNGKA